MQIEFTLTGITPLLMHARDLDAEDEIKEEVKAESLAGIKTPKGDDRFPSWKWQTYVYTNDDGYFTFPPENIQASLREGGTKIIMQKQTTYKEATQSCICVLDKSLLLVNDKPINIAPFAKLDKELFAVHAAEARKHGFQLYAKHARVNGRHHVRVRPRFDTWKVKGELTLTDPEYFGVDILKQIFDVSGKRGIGDWRPSSGKPGPYGQYKVSLKEIK